MITRGGDAVAFVHDGKIWTQYFDELEAHAFDGSQDAFAPFWSPDGSQLGWFQDGKLWKVPARGGRPVAICEITDIISGGVGAFWNANDRIFFAPGSAGIYSVSALGGKPQLHVPLTEDQGDLHEPFALANDQGILHVVHPAEKSPGVLALWRDGESSILFAAEGDSRLHNPVFDGKRYILFRLTRGEATEGLWAMDFDPSTGESRGEPFLVEPNASGGSVAEDGTLVFVSNPQRVGENMITRIGLDGLVRETVVSARAGELQFALSPEEGRICFTATARDGGAQEIWVKDLLRGTEMRLASGTDPTFFPLWTLDGSEVIFSRAELGVGSLGIYRVPADGSRPAQRVANGLASMMTPDGSSLICVLSSGRDILSFNRSDSTDFWLLPLEDPASASLLLAGQSTQFPDGISPGGNYLLYISNVSDQFTLYLTRYPSMTGRWQVSPDGNAGRASFSADGTVIYYESEMVIYAVDFQSGDNPTLGAPRQVLELPETSLEGAVPSRDGKSFLIVQEAESESEDAEGPNRQGIKLVQNWTAGIR